MTGNLSLGDDVKAQFGNDNDLQMYHQATGNISYIKESGAGSLYIQASDLLLTNTAGTQTYINASDGGGTVIRYAGANKLATTSTGIDVTGTVAATSFTGDGGSLTGIDALPTQSSQSGKFLTTDGTNANWEALSSNALSADFTVATGKTVTAGTVVNFSNGTIGDNPVVNTQTSLYVDSTYTYNVANESGTVVLRAEQDGSNHQVRVGVVQTNGSISWNSVSTIWSGQSNSGTTVYHVGGDNFALHGGEDVGWNNSATAYGYIVFFTVSPTTGGIYSTSSVYTNSLGSGNYTNRCYAFPYKMSDGKVGVYWSKTYYSTTQSPAGWYYPHDYRVATFTNSGSISNSGTDSSLTSSHDWEKVASGSKYIGPTGSSQWYHASWNGSSLSSASQITWDTTYSRDFKVYVPDASVDIFVCTFVNTSNQFMLNTYSYSGSAITKTNSHTIIDSGAGVTIGKLTGTGDNMVLGYEDNSKGYIATFTLDSTTKAVDGSGIAILHNTSNQAVHVYGPNDTNKYTCLFNDSGSKVNSSEMTVNAYASSALNWLGVAKVNGTAGNSVGVIVDGVAGGFSGLTIGTTYYYNTTDYDGTLTTVINSYKIGRAVSTTEVLLNA
jgi:hypothetical protein